MNSDVFAGQWQQMRGSVRSWWGKLTDEDLERVGGEKDKLVGLIQERYGQTKEEAEREVERRLNEYGSGGIAADLRSRATNFGANVSNKATEAAQRLSSSVDSARSYFQDRSFDELTTDVVALIRKYPVGACLIGLGLGYMVTKGIAGGDDFDEAVEDAEERKKGLMSSMRQKYRDTRDAARTEAERRMDEYAGVGEKLRTGASELGATVANKASEAVDRLSSSVGSARSYFQERNVDDLTGDLRDVIRKYPIYSCIVALGVGILSKGVMSSRDRYNSDW